MKNIFSYICLLLIGILLLGGCKKKNGDTPADPVPEPTFCYEKTYLDSIPVATSPIKIHTFTEDVNFNIVYVWTTDFFGGTSFNVTKVDSNLNHIWTHEYQGEYASINSITHDNNNNYYIVNRKYGCVKGPDGDHFFSIYLQSTFFWDTCSPHYELTDHIIRNYTDDAETVIHKISPDGTLLWSNTLDFAARKGRNMAISDDGQLFVGSYSVPCGNRALVYRDGVFQDTVNLIDSTIVILHNLSPSGSINWERQIKIPTLYYGEWYSETPDVSLDISIDEQFIYVAISNTVFTFNPEGQLIEEHAIGAQCQHVFIGSTKIKNAEAKSIFQYNTTNLNSQYLRYVGRYNLNGNIEWLEEIWADYIIETDDGGFITYTPDWNSNTEISKYDMDGDLLWRKTYGQNNYISLQAICTSGFLLLAYNHYTDPNNIIVTRTDGNGEFEQ